MADDLRTRILHTLINNTPSQYLAMPEDLSLLVDALMRELTEVIPPIVATAIQGFAQSEIVAMSYHGGCPDAVDAMERMNREALQIAKYATTHEDWNA